MQSLSWPPNFSVKKHLRARHVKLKASFQHGLEIVVPKSFNQKNIPRILEENKLWIEKQLLKIQAQQSLVKDITLPKEIIFPLLKQPWKIDYIASDNNKLRLMARPHQEIVLFGNIQNKNLCKKLLLSWIKNQAKKYLPIELRALSEEIKLPYETATVRDQSTRWGSCSSSKNINLNYKLLLLPAELAKHIMIHELCHTVHLNHSVKFWQLVEKFDSDWTIHRGMIRKSEEYLPNWVK